MKALKQNTTITISHVSDVVSGGTGGHMIVQTELVAKIHSPDVNSASSRLARLLSGKHRKGESIDVYFHYIPVGGDT
jgi:hypothetical protein